MRFNGLQAFAPDDLFQTCVAGKSAFFDGDEFFAQGHFRECRASPEGLFADGLNAIGESDLFQGLAASEGRLADLPDAVRESDRSDIGVVITAVVVPVDAGRIEEEIGNLGHFGTDYYMQAFDGSRTGTREDTDALIAVIDLDGGHCEVFAVHSHLLQLNASAEGLGIQVGQ